jgi:hypothetical protein
MDRLYTILVAYTLFEDLTMKLLLTTLLLIMSTLAAADEPKKPKLGADEAQKIVLSKVPGKVENQATAVNDGRTDYSFDVRTEKEIREIVVNGDSGQIVSNNSETEDALAKKKKKTGAMIKNGASTANGTVLK